MVRSYLDASYIYRCAGQRQEDQGDAGRRILWLAQALIALFEEEEEKEVITVHIFVVICSKLMYWTLHIEMYYSSL